MSNTKTEFTITYTESVDGGYVGIVNEVPGVMSEGETIDELRENLMDALAAMFEANRTHPTKQLKNPKVDTLQMAC